MDVKEQQIELILQEGWSILMDHSGRLPSDIYVPFTITPRPAHPGNCLPGKITRQELKRFVWFHGGVYVEVDLNKFPPSKS
jgi:hypothetical protein